MGTKSKSAQSIAHPAKRPGGLARMQQLRDSGKLSAFQSAAGKKGYKVATERHGKAAIIEKIAEYRRSNPSSVEITGAELLKILDIIVTRHRYDPVTSGGISLTIGWAEHIPFPGDNDRAYILDVAWPSLKIAIEFDGRVHQIFDTPQKQAYRLMREMDLRSAGWVIYHISGDDLRTDYGASVLVDCVALVRERAR